jgi:16S rRNA (uracil1498-N3)-methyltransferase
VGDAVELRGDDARKLTLVLRKRDGDTVQLYDSSGSAFEARLSIADGRVRAQLERTLATPAPATLEIVLAQGVPKGAKMDFVIEKATELGVSRIVPLLTERTQGEGAREGKTERWRRLARAAAQQCGRADVPEIEVPLGWAEFCARFGEYDRVLVPWELEAVEPLAERLPSLLAGVRRVAVAIGPEGGLGHAEIEQARVAGAVTISLGRRVLRTETAGLVVCGILRYVTGDL